jgi:hypothetical protein
MYMSTEGSNLYEGVCGAPELECATPCTILDRAKSVVFSERQENYGHPARNFGRIARLWNAYISEYSELRLSQEDVAVMMILMKIARLIETPDHEDSIVDIAGYAEAYARIVGIDQ